MVGGHFPRVLIPLALVLAAVVGCGPQPPVAIGTIVEIEPPGGETIHSFVLRDADGNEVEYHVGDIASRDFTRQHFDEHLATGQQVTVVYREDNLDRIVTRIVDTPGAG